VTLGRVLALVAAVAAFVTSLVLLHRVAGIGAPWIVLLSFLCFLGAARIAEPVIRLAVPARIRPVRRWESGGALYEVLGVPAFGRALRGTPLRLLNPEVYVARQGRDWLRILRSVESAEAIHFWAAVLFTPYLAWTAWRGEWRILGASLFVQVVGNAYPILHLRSVRGRIERSRGRARVRADRSGARDRDART
jgi:hypothetical protein